MSHADYGNPPTAIWVTFHYRTACGPADGVAEDLSPPIGPRLAPTPGNRGAQRPRLALPHTQQPCSWESARWS